VDNALLLEIGQRGLCCGQTGSGKSFLCIRLLPSRGRLCIIDPKREFDYPGVPIIDNPEAIRRKKPERFIYRPKESLITDREAYNQVYEFCYRAGGYFIYTDEVIAVMRGMEPPQYLNICVQLGRSKGITMLFATQRPARIPANLVSESQKFYIFTLVYPPDVKRISEMVPGFTGRMNDKRTFCFYDLHSGGCPEQLRLRVQQ
jgi:hypothetical protein